MYDILIVGAGFFGATYARKATEKGKKCLVIDKNEFLGGAAYDKEMHGIMVSQFGAHILHSHSEEIWNFFKQFGEIQDYINKPKVKSGNKIYSFPLNLMTFHQLWGVTTPQEAYQKLQEVRIPIEHPQNAEEWMLSMVGEEVYNLFFYHYTKKQWLKEPKELPVSIVQRLPIRLTYDENYFTTKYQGVPVNGYANLVKNMLTGIDVELGVDFFSLDWKKIAKNLVYSGPIDKLFDYTFGKLEYNTLKFEHKVFQGDHQGTAVINHTDGSTPYLRSVEHKHFFNPHQYKKHYGELDSEKTIVSYDLPVSFAENSEPYYPIRDECNSILYEKYAKLAKETPNLIAGGRLGNFRYSDLDQVVASAISKVEKYCL